MIRRGYRLPFAQYPSQCFLKNNRSALQHPEFVADANIDLVSNGIFVEHVVPPFCVNTLTVAEGKKLLLVIDLRQPDKCSATAASFIQREELSSSGLLCNEEKSHWTPMHIGEWLGFAIDSISLSFRISEKKVSKLKGLLDSVIRAGYSSFCELARIAGTIISVALAVGPIFRLLTDRCISPLKPCQHGTTPFIFPPVFYSSSNFGTATSIALTVILLGHH